jgi:lysozyme family protein
MNLIEELRYEISRTINTLRLRYANSADPAERKTILDSIAELNGKLSILNQASLLQAASVLADATEDVTAVIAAARMGPFDGYLAAIEQHLNRLYSLSGEMHAFEALPPAPEETPGEPPAEGAAAATTSRGLTRARGPLAELEAPLPSKNFAQLKSEYQAWFDACKVRAGQQGAVDYYLKRLRQGQPSYEQVGQELNGIPWYFIGVIHGMECGFNFNGHLHNGDPLNARTVHVPAGRPQTGAPPFTWRQSARDALTMKGFQQVTDWSVPHILYFLERYNGMGYRMRRVATPYLWSFSNLYSKGKFVQDGHFDPTAVSKQCGAALMLKTVLSAGARTIRRQGRGR